MIIIKLNLNDKVKVYQSFDELIKLDNYHEIKDINCSFCRLTKLPDNLPRNLMFLRCNDNELKELPDNLPQKLQFLRCSNNKLTELSDNLPQQLIYLDCNNNELTQLPILPQKLQELYCSNNQLKELPTLPQNLIEFICSDNQLEQLPILPQQLQSLNCEKNELKQLPTLPQKLQELSCEKNKLTELSSSIPQQIKLIRCRDNKFKNEIDRSKKYYKLTNESSINKDFQLHNGLNIDDKFIDYNKECLPGLYFCEKEYVNYWLYTLGYNYIYDVEIPDDTIVHNQGHKLKANKLILSNFREIKTLA